MNWTINFKHISGITLFLLTFVAGTLTAQEIPTPKSHFGFDIGDDYSLANYTQAEAYFKKLAKISDRVLIQEIGKTEENRNQYILVISSPENLKNIKRYQEISQRLARAEQLTDQEATALAQEGKAVVWIDGGLHANETVATQQLIQLYYKLLSANDKETLRILDHVIILLSQVNPDGQELMSDWYMQEKDVTKRNMNVPRLYQKYIGHDNNRDFYMNNMKESTNISRQQYIEWMPQIVYNHHQTAPSGAVVAGPPYRDPFNFTYDPLLITGIDGVAAAMINRLNAEGKPGYTRLSGSVYSTWWNGGLRTTPYFHNMIGILTEITGHPTPSSIPLVADRLIPNNATPYPVHPQQWKFKQSIEYSLSLNYGILDYASRQSDQLLYNIYLMGRNAIQKGNQDTWSLLPKHTASIKAALTKSIKGGDAQKAYDDVYLNPDLRDARAYIISAQQRDFPTAVKFVNALIKSGVLVHQAKDKFNVDGKNYPAGSFIVKTNQAFRAHILDMFEPQDHPNDFQYPGGPPVRPYDAAGWTLAFQMGVAFDKILHHIDGPFTRIPYGELQSPPIKDVEVAGAGYILPGAVNNTFIAVNDLMKAGFDVFRLNKSVAGAAIGDIYVTAKASSLIRKIAAEQGIAPVSLKTKPDGLTRLAPARIALYDKYGGSISSGWVRWIMEQFHFAADVVYPQDLDLGSLNKKYDVILFLNEYIPNPNKAELPRRRSGPEKSDIPAAYHHMLGSITAEKTIPELKKFMEKGGAVVTIGSSTALAYHLNLPVSNALNNLKAEEFYIPGSILQLTVDTTQLTNFGMPPNVDVVYNQSPVFTINKNDGENAVRALAWFEEGEVLRSGWAWGQQHLKGRVAAFNAKIGKGTFYAFGPEITFRGQSHGTFKMLFNELYQYKK